MTLDLYVVRRYLITLLKVQLILLGLILLFDSVDILQDLGLKSGMGPVASLSLVRAPAIVSKTFPLVVLLASLWTFLGLARSSELVVSRAAGVSGLRLGSYPVIATLILGVVAFSLVNPLVSATTRREARMQEELGNSRSTSLSVTGANIWLRQGGENGQIVVQADRAEPDGTVLYDVRMFEFDAKGTLTSRIEAKKAELLAGEWRVTQARRWDLTKMPLIEAVPFESLSIPTDLTASHLLESFDNPETISFWKLPEFIANMERSGFSPVRHRLFLQTELARPVVFMAMLLIGMAFSMRPVRFGNVAIMVLAAVLAGFTFYFVLDVAASFAAARQVPILVAAWAPPVAASLLALAQLLHFEDG